MTVPVGVTLIGEGIGNTVIDCNYNGTFVTLLAGTSICDLNVIERTRAPLAHLLSPHSRECAWLRRLGDVFHVGLPGLPSR